MENLKEPAQQRLLLRIPEVMTMLGLGRTTIYALIGSGDLPVIRVGKAVWIPMTALEKWVEEQQHHDADSAPYTLITRPLEAHRRCSLFHPATRHHGASST